jgi:hypothetical protein
MFNTKAFFDVCAKRRESEGERVRGSPESGEWVETVVFPDERRFPGAALLGITKVYESRLPRLAQ